ncbi:MAG: DUF2170 family protein [Halopseudomonas sp.]
MAWSLNDLNALLEKQEDLSVSKEGDAIFISNEDGIDAFVTVSGEQLLVESLLCPVSQISDTAAFNALILRTHKNVFPLTAIGITKIGDEEYYAAFGALSSESKAESVLIEIDTLFLNIEGMLEFFEEFLS